ncbi:hypothetical protein Q5M87_08435 [Brachyspira innocens]|uniref:hypothetical protein n=1 Tax=Brachyspira innocens TaxID=13264 RepID=UPI0026EFBC34|nr:hypothetical protein [Brachyspira innocens]MDO6994034.1 hypothetical protein [Brachyspira innocens]
MYINFSLSLVVNISSSPSNDILDILPNKFIYLSLAVSSVLSVFISFIKILSSLMV